MRLCRIDMSLPWTKIVVVREASTPKLAPQSNGPELSGWNLFLNKEHELNGNGLLSRIWKGLSYLSSVG